MGLAEQLKNEVNVLNELPWLKEGVINGIKNYGRYRLICDTHISKPNRNFSVPYKYWTPISDWARKEGFRVSADYNSYGVKHLVIEL